MFAVRSLEPGPEALRWLDLAAGENTIRVPGLTFHYQYPITREAMLAKPVSVEAFAGGSVLDTHPDSR